MCLGDVGRQGDAGGGAKAEVGSWGWGICSRDEKGKCGGVRGFRGKD